MSITLELEPDVETSFYSYAAAEGVTPDRFIVRLLKGYRPTSLAPPAEPEWKAKLKAGQQIMSRAFVASGKTDDEMAADADAEIKAYRAERVEAEAASAPRASGNAANTASRVAELGVATARASSLAKAVRAPQRANRVVTVDLPQAMPIIFT